jgi:hypothetical protein
VDAVELNGRDKMHTLCLDLDNIGFSQLKPILTYIVSCPHSRSVRYRNSSCLDGYHVMVDCENDGCDYCKRKWDDWKHYFHYKWGDRGDILFDQKTLRKGGHQIILMADIWISVKEGNGDG